MINEPDERRLPGGLALLALAALVVLACALQRPPAPAPTSASANEFSAERAYVDLLQMAGPEPTPIGSTGSDVIRDYLVTTLSRAKFRVSV